MFLKKKKLKPQHVTQWTRSKWQSKIYRNCWYYVIQSFETEALVMVYKSTWVPSDKQAGYICCSTWDRRLECGWSIAAREGWQIHWNYILQLKSKWKQCLRRCGYQKACKPRRRGRNKSALFVTVHCWGKIYQSNKGHIRDVTKAYNNKD